MYLRPNWYNNVVYYLTKVAWYAMKIGQVYREGDECIPGERCGKYNNSFYSCCSNPDLSTASLRFSFVLFRSIQE